MGEQDEQKKTILVAFIEDTSPEGNKRVNTFMDHGGADLVIQMNRVFDFIRLFIKDNEVYIALNDLLEKKHIFASMQRNDNDWVVLGIYKGHYDIKIVCQNLFRYLIEAGFNPLISDDWKRAEGMYQY